MAETLKELYQKLDKANIKLPDYNTFEQKYKTEGGAEDLYKKLNAANIKLPDIDTFKSKYFEQPYVAPKEPAGFFDGLVSQFTDLFGTKADQSKAYLDALSKGKSGNVATLPKTDWEAYNDLTNLLKPVNKPLSAEDYTVTDNYLKSLNITTKGESDNEDNPFMFEYGSVQDKDSYLRTKDEIEKVRRRKVQEIRNAYDAQIEAEKAKKQDQYGFAYSLYKPVESLFDLNPKIEKLEKERDRQIKETEEQFSSYDSNITAPQLVRNGSFSKIENLGIGQLSKNVLKDPITGRQYFDTKNAIKDINNSTLDIKQKIGLFDEDLKSGPSVMFDPATGETSSKGGKLYDFLGSYGIELQYNGDNKSRDIAMSNFNYGNLSQSNVDLPFGMSNFKTSNIERDGYVFNGLKAQVQVIDKQIEASQKQIEKLSVLANQGQGQQRKENVDFINSLNQNVVALKQLKQKITQWGDTNLEDYKKYLSSQKELNRIANQAPVGNILSYFAEKTIDLVPDLLQLPARYVFPFSESAKQKIRVGPDSKRTVGLSDVLLKRMETPTLEGLEPTVIQKGVEIPLSQAETFTKPENVSGLNPFNYTISPRPFFYNTLVGVRDLVLLGGVGGAIESGLSRTAGSAILLATEGTLKNQVAWNLEKQIAKNIASASASEAVGASVLKYNVGNAAIAGTKFANRVVAMTIPTAAIYGNEINQQFLDSGFRPDEAAKLGALSVFLEGASESIFGNEVRLYNALVDGTSDAAIRNTANNVLERAFRDRAKSYLGKELTEGQLGTLKKFWLNLQKLKNSKGVTSVLDGITKFGGGAFKTFGEESLEEISTNLGNAIFTSPLGRSYNPEYKGEDFTLENQVATALNTIATMLPMGFGTGYVNYKNFNKAERIEGLQAKYEVGLNPGVHVGILSEAFNNGEISKEEYEKRVALVKRYGQYGNDAMKNALAVAVKNGYSISELDNQRIKLFEEYLQKDKLETLFSQATTDEDKAGFAQLIAEKNEQIAKYISNGLYENEEDRRKANLQSLNYLFNDATVKAYRDEKTLEPVLEQLVEQSMIETDPEIVKAYESKINLLDRRKKEIIAKKKEDAETAEVKAAKNNAKGSITIPGLILEDLNLKYNTPYYYTPNQPEVNEEGQEVFTTQKISILKDNGDGTLQVLLDDLEEKTIPIEDLTNSEVVEEEQVEKWKKSNSPKAIAFEHKNDLFSYDFDKPAENRNRIETGKIRYNDTRNGLDFIYKTKDGKVAVKKLTRSEIKELNKGKLKYIKSYETAEQFYKRTKKLEEQAAKVSFEEAINEPLRKWEFIANFIESKTQELANTKELINQIQEKLKEANKKVEEFIDNIDNNKTVDVQDIFDTVNNLKDQVRYLEEDLKILEEQKADLEDQIEYTKKYDTPEFAEDKTLVDELIDDQFNLEVQLEKVNDVIGFLREFISEIENTIGKISNVINDIIDSVASIYPGIKVDFLKQNVLRSTPSLSRKYPDAYKEIGEFNKAINENLTKIQIQQKDLNDARKSFEANIDLAKKIQKEIRFQEELIEKAVENQKKLQEQSTEKKIKELADEIFKNQENTQSSNQTNDPNEDAKNVKEENQKIPLSLFFATATSGVTFEGGFNLDDPAILRLQNFSNNVKDPENYSFIIITVDNAKEYGLEDAIYSDDVITNQGADESKYDIKLLIVDKKTQNPVNQEGVETNNPKQYVYTSLRQAKTTWSNGEKSYFATKGKEAEDEKLAKLYEQKHKELRFELIGQTKKGNKQKLDIKYVSRGRRVNEGKQNSAMGVVLPANFDLENEKAITVATPSEPDSKTGKVAYGNGNVSINMPVGRPIIATGNAFEFLYNKKFGKKDVDKFVKIFKALYDAYKIGDKVKVNNIVEYLSKVLYVRNPLSSAVYKENQKTKIGRSQIWISNVAGTLYLNLGSEGGRIPFNFEKENINAFFSMYAFFTGKDGKGVYHNVDVKKDGEGLIGKAFVEITDVKENGELVTRRWPSYQSYLLSDKLPDGTARPIEDIPLTVNMQPSSPTTPNRAGRYLVYENPLNQEVTNANPRITVVEKKPSGKKTEKGTVTKAQTVAPKKYKETSSDDIQDLKNLKPGKVYRWKVERENVSHFVDFFISEKNWVEVLDHNYKDDKNQKIDNRQIARKLNEFVSKDKKRGPGEESSKPGTVVIYELVSTEPVKETPAKKQTGKKATSKKKAKKKEEEEDEEEEEEDDDDEEKTSTNPTKTNDSVKKISEKEIEALFKSAELPKEEQDEDEEGPATGGEFRVVVPKQTAYPLENIEEAKKWLSEVLPQIEFKLVNGLIHNRAWGMLKGAVITLSDLAEVGTIYHEAFEAVQKYVLSPKEIRMLRREFRKREGTFIDRETGKTVKYAEASNYQIKEQVSEEYRDYQLSGRTKTWKGEYRKTNLFEKIANFVDFVILYLSGKSTTINDVFEKLSSAAYKDKVIRPFVNRINPEYRVADGRNSLKNTNPKMFRKVMDSMTNLLVESVKKSEKSIIDTFKYDLQSNVEYDKMRKELKSFYNLSVPDKDLKYEKLINLVKTKDINEFKTIMDDAKIALLFFNKNYNTSFISNLSSKMKDNGYLEPSFNPGDSKKIAKNAGLFYEALQKGGAEIMYNAVSSYNYIDSNWEDLVKEHKQFLSRYSIEFDIEDENMEQAKIDDEDQAGGNYAPEVNKISRKENASFEVKLLIATLKDMTFDYSKESKFSADELRVARPKVNDLLLSNVVDYGKVFVNLLYKLAPATNINEMFDILKQEAETDAVIELLARKLKIGETNLTEYDIDLRAKFYISMNSLIVNYSKLLVFPNSKMSMIGEINQMNEFGNIREKWINQTVSNQSKIIRLNQNTKKYEIIKENFEMQIRGIDDAFKFLNMLGYGFDFSPSELDAEEKKTTVTEASKLYQLLKDSKNVEQLFQDSAAIRNSLNNLAIIYMKYGNTYAEPQHLNIEGEAVQNILLHNYIGTIVKTFNISKGLQGLIDKIPQLNPKAIGNAFLSYSQILDPNSKFYKDGKLVKNLSVQVMEGIEILDSSDYATTAKSTLRDRVGQEFAYNLKGLYYILTPADAKMQWGINFGTFLTQVETSDDTTVLNIFKKYLKAEILAAQQDNIANLSILEKQGSKLRFFRDILTFDIDLNKDADQIIKENEEKIDNDILQFINRDVQGTYDFFEKNDLISPYVNETEGESFGEQFTPIGAEGQLSEKNYTILYAPTEFIKEGGLTDQEVRNLIRFSNINYMFNIFEQYKLFWGDPAQWKDPTKRIKSFTSGRNLSVNRDSDFNDFYNKKLNTYQIIDDNGEVQTITLKPGDFGYVYYNDEIRTTTYADVTIENPNLPGYTEVVEPDGQGIVFPNGYREIRQRGGTWTDAEDEQHQWDMALCRWEVTNGIRWEDRNKENPDKLIDKQNLYPEGERGELLKRYDREILERGNPYLNNSKAASENKSPIKTAITNVLKPIYSGLKKAFVDGLGIRTDYNSVVMNLDKFSLAPMTWRLVRGRNSQQFFIEHFKKNTTYIKFESANKVGNTADIENLYDENGEINLKYDKEGNVTNIKHDVLDYKYFGIQVETKTQKEYSTLGTQLTVMINLNLDPQKRADLIRKNNVYLEALKLIAKKEIFKKFNIKEEYRKGKKVFVFKNFEKIQELLKDELNRRDAPENLKNALELDENGNFVLKFDMMIGSERLESVITSIIDKEILRPKMFGGQMPQIASTLFEQEKRNFIIKNERTNKWEKVDDVTKLSKEKREKAVLTSGDLLFYGDKYVEENGTTRRATDNEIASGKAKTAKFAEVYLPFFMKQFIEEGVELSINDLPEDLKYGIAFRIPTQNTNSIENFRIKGFLPVEYGNSIVVPSEITKKAGSDFDIDKLNIYLYNYFINTQGKPEKIKFDSRPSYDDEEKKIISEATKERYDILIRRRDPQAFEIREEYQKKIDDVKDQIIKLRKKEKEEIRLLKEQAKAETESEKDELFVAIKSAKDKITQLISERKDVKAIIKDFEKGFKEDYDSTKRIANIDGYQGDRLAIFTALDKELEEIDNEISNYTDDVRALEDRIKNVRVTNFRQEQIDKKYEERKKNDDYLVSLKKELILERAKKINEIVPSMSLEEFASLPIVMQNSKKAIENAYIDNIREILELPEMFDYLTKPNSAQELKDEAKDINELYGINKETRPSYYYISRLKNAEDRHSFLVGKDAVGIAASHQKQHAMSQIIGLSFTTNQKPKFFLNFPCNFTEDNNVITYSLAGVFDKAGKVISDTISMFVDGAVDIAKDPYIFDLNANYNTYSIYLTAIRLGVPLNIVTRWYNQPIIREYVKLMQEKKSMAGKLNGEDFRKKEMIKKAMKAVDAVRDPEYTRTEDFTAEELEGYIKQFVKSQEEGGPVTSLDFRKTQTVLLDQFLLMEELSWDLFRFGQAINLDTSRTVSFESIRIKIGKIDAALKGPFKEYVIKVFNSTFIGSIYTAKNELLEAIKPLYLTESDVARSILNPILQKIYTSAGSQDDIEQKARLLKRHFVNYLIQVLPIEFEKGKKPVLLSSFIRSLLLDSSKENARNLTAAKLRRIQVKQKNNQLPENFFVDNLLGVIRGFVQTPGKIVNNIQLTRRMIDKTDVDLAVADFRNLDIDQLSNDDLAQELVKTALLQSGVIVNPKSFSQLIPNEMFKDIAVQIQNHFQDLGNIEKYLENFENSYYQNQWYDRNVIPKASKFTKSEKPKPRLSKEWLSVKKVNKKGELVSKSIPVLQYFITSDKDIEERKNAFYSNETRSPYLIYMDEKKDFDGSPKYSYKEKAEMKKVGDYSFLDYILFKRLEITREDGNKDVPLGKEVKSKVKGVEKSSYYILYYPVPRYGEKFTLFEHYGKPQKSQVIEENIQPFTDQDVIDILKDKDKFSEKLLFRDVFPYLDSSQEEFMEDVKNAVSVEESKLTLDQMMGISVPKTKTREQEDYNIINSEDFKNWSATELEKNPGASTDDLLEHYKKCKQ